MTQEFKIGDTVTDVILGKTGKVTCDDVETIQGKQIEVTTDDGKYYYYHVDGRYAKEDAIPRLYHGEVTIEIKQPVYEYQVIYRHRNCVYEMSCGYYRDGEEFNLCNSAKFIELYQPSKRVRK